VGEGAGALIVALLKKVKLLIILFKSDLFHFVEKNDGISASCENVSSATFKLAA
jgi:hypothetical protein